MNLQAAREQMVEQQVRAWDVLDERVLQTMLQVQREEFAPLRLPRRRVRGRRDSARARPVDAAGEGARAHPAGARRSAKATSPWKSAPAAATCPPAWASSPRACARWRFFPSSPSRRAPICSPPRINNVSVEAADAMQLERAVRLRRHRRDRLAADLRRALPAGAAHRRAAVRRRRPGADHGSVARHARRRARVAARQACSRPCSSRSSMRRGHRHSCSDPVTFRFQPGSSRKSHLIHDRRRNHADRIRRAPRSAASR